MRLYTVPHVQLSTILDKQGDETTVPHVQFSTGILDKQGDETIYCTPCTALYRLNSYL